MWRLCEVEEEDGIAVGGVVTGTSTMVVGSCLNGEMW